MKTHPNTLLNAALKLQESAEAVTTPLAKVTLKAVNHEGQIVAWQSYEQFQAFKATPHVGRFKEKQTFDADSFERACFDAEYRNNLSDDQLTEALAALVRSQRFTGEYLANLNLANAALILTRHGLAVPSGWAGFSRPLFNFNQQGA